MPNHTSRRDFINTVCRTASAGGIGSALGGIHACGGAARGKPNVVLVITDDQGYGDLACHGNPVIETPHLDQLHSESTRFTNFHVDPLCAPTRAGLLTGRYAYRTGVTAAFGGRSILRRGEVTMADIFRNNGYRTGQFGKWHLGDNYPYRPNERGFDESVTCWSGGVTQAADYWGNDYFDDTYYRNNQPEKFSGYCTDVYFNEAIRFVEENRQQPFFLYLPTNAPHAPYFVDRKYSKPYLDRGVAPQMAAFYGMITNLDENVGRLRAKLSELELEENTIFIFMTDNGTAAGVLTPKEQSDWKGFNAGMRERKGSQYDGGHRVPFFIRWPAGGIDGPKDVGRLAAHIDVLPTLIQLVGLPGRAKHQFRRDQPGAAGDRRRRVPRGPYPFHPASAVSHRRRVADGNAQAVSAFFGADRALAFGEWQGTIRDWSRSGAGE